MKVFDLGISSNLGKGLNKILITVFKKLRKGLIMMRLTSLFNLQLTVGVFRGIGKKEVTVTITNKYGSYWRDPHIHVVVGTTTNGLPATLKNGKNEFGKYRGALV